MADIFNFGDPNNAGLLGMISGLGEAAMPSRMPVPLGAVLGKAAGGYAQGVKSAQEYQKLATENALQNLTLQGWQNYMGMSNPQSQSQPQPSLAQRIGNWFNGSSAPQDTPAQPNAPSGAVPPAAVKSPLAIGAPPTPGNPLINLPAMVNMARAGMFPGGPGAQMFGPLMSYADTVAKQGYQPSVNADGSMGVTPLNGIDNVLRMLEQSKGFGKTTGENQQNITGYDSAGNPIVSQASGSLAGIGQRELAKSQADLPAELQKIQAQGAETRATENFKTGITPYNWKTIGSDGVTVIDRQGTMRDFLNDRNASARSLNSNSTFLPSGVSLPPSGNAASPPPLTPGTTDIPIGLPEKQTEVAKKAAEGATNAAQVGAVTKNLNAAIDRALAINDKVPSGSLGLDEAQVIKSNLPLIGDGQAAKYAALWNQEIGSNILNGLGQLKGLGRLDIPEVKQVIATYGIDMANKPEARKAALENLRQLINNNAATAKNVVANTNEPGIASRTGQSPVSNTPVTAQSGIDPLQSARDAITKGAPRDKVIERLRNNNIAIPDNF